MFARRSSSLLCTRSGAPHLRTLCALALSTLGCASIPENRITLDRIDFVGNESVGDRELSKKIASAESPRFLGLFRGLVYDYEIFDRYVLERDLKRIERYYQARGYYKARARAGRVIHTSQRHVRVEIVVDEGPPTRIDRVDLHGLVGLPPEIVFEAALAVRVELKVGEPFDEERFERAEERLRQALTDRGYAYAKVRRAAEVDLPSDLAAVGFWVTPGRVARYGPITIEGLGSIPRGPVERALDLRSGDPYSSSELAEAERAILDLGIFSSVRIQADQGEGDEQPELVPIRVSVEPIRPRSVYFGGGLQIDSVKTEAHLRAGWEHHNFFGGLRRFLIEAVPGLVFHPTRVPDFEAPERVLPQLRLRSEFRQPGVLEPRTNLLLRGQLDIYPVLFSEDPGAGDDAPILGYREIRASVGLDRSIWRAYVALSQNFQQNTPFSYRGPLDPDLGAVVISYPEVAAALDLRDQKLHPHEGIYLFSSLQVAGVGGEARDIKVQPEIRGFVPLGLERLTLAARAEIGLLFPFNYGDTLVENSERGVPPPGVSRAEWVRDVQLTFLRGFFSGGPSSNRGYAFREIGPHGVVPFYNPGQTTAEINTNCAPDSPEFSTARCDLPLGGLTLWEASLEVRYPISGPLLGAVFVDASDVSPSVLNIRLTRPHLSTGFGLRYDTPVGPIRLDVGYRIPGLQGSGGADDSTPVETLGLPIALSFGIGEAF